MNIPSGSDGYDPVFKVRYVLKLIQEGLLKVWTEKKDVAINESMIKYMGRAIAWVQYMPAKPIKHGIKALRQKDLWCLVIATNVSFV